MVKRANTNVRNRGPPSPWTRYNSVGDGRGRKRSKARVGEKARDDVGKRWGPAGWIMDAQIGYNFQEEYYDRVHGDGAL